MLVKKESVFLTLFIAFIALLSACSDPIKEQEEEDEEVYQDSVKQGNIDAEIINDYLISIGMEDDVLSGEYGLSYVVLEEGTGGYPKINDIVSTDYIGKYTNGEIFDTSIKEVAITNDSLYWVGQGVDLQELMDASGDDLETVIYELNVEVALDNLLFSTARTYEPVTFNHTAEGTGISTGFITGFRYGLHLLTPLLNDDGKGAAIMPSAIAYGTVGSSGGRIPPNTVLIFEFVVDSIRVQ